MPAKWNEPNNYYTISRVDKYDTNLLYIVVAIYGSRYCFPKLPFLSFSLSLSL